MNIEEVRARCKFNAALAKLRDRPWMVFILEDSQFATAHYNALPSRLAAGIIQNQQIRKAAGMRGF